ncbi:MAG TPA: HPF/RaiA family ribosome-associated protein [Polyangiales bacterium]|nr:HPF/RaiA family ribosome-associated protein [Polyangiales bacterium]
MRLHVRARNISLSDELMAHVDRHIHFALSRFADRIQTVHVSLWDLNGPRGGIDKACRVRILLRFGRVLNFEDVDTTLHAVVSRVCDRASRHVGRELARQRSTSRHLA